VDQYEAFRAPLRKNRKEDFLLATPEERVAVLEKCGVVTSQMFRLERERVKRLKEDWSPHLEEMARTYPTKHQGPQGVRQSLKRSGRTWSAIGRRMSLKSAKVTYGARLPVDHVPMAKATAPRGLEALVRAQSDLPTTGANLTIKWEKVAVEGKSDAFVCCTCMLECCVVSRVVLRV
jgi:hypothetical protein